MKEKYQIALKHKNKILGGLFAFVIFGLLLLNSFNLIYLNKIFPGVRVAGQDLGGLTKEEAFEKINNLQISDSIELTWQKQEYELKTNDFYLKYKPEETIDIVYNYGRTGKPFKRFTDQINALKYKINVPLSYQIDEQALDSKLGAISSQITIPVIEPSVSVENDQIIVNPGKEGQQVQTNQLKTEIYYQIANNKRSTIPIEIKKIDPRLTESEIENLKNRAINLLGKTLDVTFEFQTFSYKTSEIVVLLEPFKDKTNNDKFPGVDQDQVLELTDNIAKSIEREPQDAKFVFENNKVKDFTPGKDGIKVVSGEFIIRISNAIKTLDNTNENKVSVSIPIKKTSPQIGTGDANTLGIKELIGHGESQFKGSIASRVHNLSVATERLNGTIIKAGEEFSFNGSVGEISLATGYERAFVIKQGKTILDDGGGVCQVSTTIFRAALNSGLPITERHPHSYRVTYYEQRAKPGIDATIYQPGVDFKFKNDTGFNILIQAKVNKQTSTLTFDFYGTSDGRVVEVGNFRLWEIIPPPPSLYTEDLSLPAGTIKQTERANSGARASFDYKVTRNGEELQKRTFYSKYQAWQAVYLLGPGATHPAQQ